MGLVRQLRAQLDQCAEQFPVAVVGDARATVEAIREQVSAELTDSDNDHAHLARDMLALVLEELQAAGTVFAHARDCTTDYAGTR